LYRWEQKFGGAGVPELQRLKALAHENAKRKRMYADRAMLADRVLSRTGRCGRADAGRRGCAHHHGVAGDRGTAWPLGLLEVF
jgi:hypothetical protein